jgi:UDP-N-acetyl-D-galactosamine dehydrogenase
MKSQLANAIVCLVGMGYVGLPLAETFARHFHVIGFDTDVKKVEKLKKSARKEPIAFTDNASLINQADFVILCVPTPLTRSSEPDLTHLRDAARTVGRNMKRGATVVLESTVYPGVTEGILQPILEKESGLKAGLDFKVAYSPERINPGDKDRTVDKVTKVVAGMDRETTLAVAELYRKVTPHIYIAPSIKVAEAAKVIENIQRDLNIALVNELAIIFHRLGLSSAAVLDAAATKWNFHRYSPGLVGGHCIPVDPHYLVYRARELGYHPRVILAGRAINDYMPEYVAELTIKALNEVSKVIKGSRVLILGLTYKEDVPDIRESPAWGIIKKLQEYGIRVLGFEPLLPIEDLDKEFDIELLDHTGMEKLESDKVDGIILAAAHTLFRQFSLDDLKQMQRGRPVLIDVRQFFKAEEAEKAGFYYQSL